MKLRKVWLLASLMAGSLSASAQSEYLKSYNVQRALEVINEDVQEAYKYVDKETDDTDRNPYAWMLLGKCFHIVDAEGQALTYTNRALDLLTSKKHKRIPEDPQWIAASYLQRAEVYDILDHQDLRLADLQAAMKLGKFPTSTQALDVEPLDVAMALAQYYFEQHQYDQSDAVYRQAMTLDPHDARPYIGLGRNDCQRAQWDDALTHFRQAAETDPEYEPYHIYMVEPLMNLGQKQEAVSEWWSAVQVSNTQENAMTFLVEDSVRVKMADEFEEMFRSKQPLDEEMEFMKATFQLSNNWLDRAEASFRELESEEAFEELSWTALAKCLNLQGKFDEALEYAELLMAKDSTDSHNCFSKASVLLSMGRHDEALALFEQAVELDPDIANLYYSQSLCHERMGNLEQALVLRRTALLLEPENVELHASLGELLMQLGNVEEMRSEVDWVLAQDTVPCQESHRYKALQLAGRYDEAMAWLEQMDEAYPFEHISNLLDRAELMVAKGDLTAARNYLQEASQLGYRRFSVARRNYLFRDHPELFDNL